MTATIRVATPQDAEAILAIYAPIVRTTPISFEVEPPPLGEMEQRIAHTLPCLPWLVADSQGEVRGYAYSSQHRTRAAYQWSVNVSVYIREQSRRTGLGRALYSSLFQLLTQQGYYQCYAGITLPNPGSVGLHETVGFRPVGVYRNVGHKLGAWHDVGWWERGLRKCDGSPAPPIPFDTLRRSSSAWEAALQMCRI